MSFAPRCLASEFLQLEYGVAVAESVSSSSTPSTTAGEKLWLTKSGDRITGPFSTSELIRKLKAKEIIIIDEVIEPNSRWKHIRDVIDFAGVVEEIRHGLMANKEDTEVGTVSLVDDEKTPITLVPRNSSVPAERRTAAAAADRSSNSTSNSDSRKSETTSSAAAAAKVTDDRGIRSTQPLPREQASNVMSRTLMGAAVVVALVLGGALFLRSKQTPSGQTESQDLSRMTAEAEFALRTGDTSRASTIYSRLAELNNATPEVRLLDAILTLRADRQTLAAKRKFEALLSSEVREPSISTRARIGLALASQQSDDVKDAIERLEKLSVEPSASPLVLFNLAALSSELAQPNNATKYLQGLDSHPQLGEATSLLKAILLTEAGEWKSVLALAQSLNGRRLGPYRFELMTLAAAAEGSIESRRRATAFLNEAWSSDPLQGHDFYFDPLVYTEALRWDRTLKAIVGWSEKSRSSEIKALSVIVMSLADRTAEAEATARELLASRPTDPHLLTAQAFLFYRLSRIDEARAALRFLNTAEGQKLKLAELLRARICAAQENIDSTDEFCAKVPWADLAASPNAPVFAQTEWVRRSLQLDGGDPSVLREAQARFEQLKLNFPDSSLLLKLTAELSGASASR